MQDIFELYGHYSERAFDTDGREEYGLSGLLKIANDCKPLILQKIAATSNELEAMSLVNEIVDIYQCIISNQYLSSTKIRRHLTELLCIKVEELRDQCIELGI